MQSNVIVEQPPGPYINLGRAAKLIPERPSVNAVWRWARKGVLARGGDRVRLEHVRLGGRVYTTEQWVREFGVKLAKADAAHFDKTEEAARDERAVADRRDALQDRIDQELEEAGL